VGISGGWRATNEEIEESVRSQVREIIGRGDGIVSGGALGVDYLALDEALQDNPAADRIKIFLPVPLESYATHYCQRAEESVISREQAENLIKQLSALKRINPAALLEDTDTNMVNQATYYRRNSAVVEAADELIAFRIRSAASEGLGTKDTVDKARAKGIPVKVYEFDLSRKTLKFRHHLAQEILAGRKHVTWRLFDDKDLQLGDQLEFRDWETKEKFATAEITQVREKKLSAIQEEDFAGHEQFASQEDMLKHYREYYGDKVTGDTIVKIIDFKLVQSE